MSFFKSGRAGEIRTLDPLHPMQVRYQAALRPDSRSTGFNQGTYSRCGANTLGQDKVLAFIKRRETNSQETIQHTENKSVAIYWWSTKKHAVVHNDTPRNSHIVRLSVYAIKRYKLITTSDNSIRNPTILSPK